jgi:glutamyl-tRNA synthetase
MVKCVLAHLIDPLIVILGLVPRTQPTTNADARWTMGPRDKPEDDKRGVGGTPRKDLVPKMPTSVVTRFAPSPTGFLHIGGGRTALFNWLYARARGGKFLLRIEDTDRERSTEAAVDAIIDGMKWLGLDWDGETVYQFARAGRHREIAEALLASGHAYRCYCSPDELDAMREKAKAEHRPPVYDGTWRDRDPKDAPAGVAPVIRIKAPREGEMVVDDQVQGRVVFKNEHLDDLIILRSDGTPTYNLSVVVDDHDMGVTHIIRGDDHLTNAARQSLIYKGMGWDIPSFSHVALIHGADGAKLSKRHGALGVDAYRAMGYLPVALRNYLVRLGWSHGDDEFFSTEEMLKHFDLPQIGRSPSRFDFTKLENMNGHYIRAAADIDLVAAVQAMLASTPEGMAEAAQLTDADWARFATAMPGLKERAKTLRELFDAGAYLFATRPIVIDDAAGKLLTPEAKAMLATLSVILAKVKPWTAADLETALKAHADAAGLKLGKLAQPLRAALTGRTTSPGIFDVLAVLGRTESLGRLADAAR